MYLYVNLPHATETGDRLDKASADHVLVVVSWLQIYPDPELEQQILALPIRCIHSEEGCRWTGQMKQLQVSICLPGFLTLFLPLSLILSLSHPV